MYQPIPLEDILSALPADRQEAIAARGLELIASVERRLNLAQLRQRSRLSQAELAGRLGIGQVQVSRLEQRKDPRLSTLHRSVAAMGGRLTLVATFPDEDPVVLVPSPPSRRKPNSRGKSASKLSSAP